jgi:hypothetical protein
MPPVEPKSLRFKHVLTLVIPGCNTEVEAIIGMGWMRVGLSECQRRRGWEAVASRWAEQEEEEVINEQRRGQDVINDDNKRRIKQELRKKKNRTTSVSRGWWRSVRFQHEERS